MVARVFLSALLVFCHAARAANPGDEVVVIYNSAMPDSRQVALHYAAKRSVPSNQVFGFELSTKEEITRAEFRDSLQRPLAQKLASERLWRVTSQVLPAANTNQERQVEWRVSESKIRYAVLCYGVPLKIAQDPTLKEPIAEKTRPELRRDEAAVDSELALLPLQEQGLPLTGPLRNPVYSTTNVSQLHPTNGVLLVTRLDGPSPEIARNLVDKALQAEHSGLWGRAYFDVRSVTDPGYKQGDDWIRAAYELSRHLGLESVIDTNPATFSAAFPMSQIAFYLGWYDGTVSGPFTRKNVEFMPGAIAYHIHSSSAAKLRTTDEHWAGPLLAKGATATMGAVYEPYLAGTPDLGTFTARIIFNGFTFGEAAYASQAVLSWQTTVVGDPLYRPFGKNGDALHKELETNHSPLVAWSWLRLANLNLANGRSASDWVTFLEQLPLAKTNAVLTEKLGDLYAAQGKPSSAVHAYNRALTLDPTPMQRLRLFIALGEKLTSLARYEEAYKNYEALLDSYPDYPGKLTVYRHMEPLALKLNRDDDARKLAAEIARLAPPPPKS